MLLERKKTCVVIFNMQLELIPLLENGVVLLNNCVWLADLATSLQLPLIIIEHKKLGKLSSRLLNVAPKAKILEKEYFDFTLHENIKNDLQNTKAEQFVFAGAETHICLLQSAIGLKNLGKQVYLLGDSISTRNSIDQTLAMQRLKQLNLEIISQEMFFFEMIRNSEISEYHGLAMKYLDGRYIS